ncbi:MAG: hypothetical protein HKM01_04725 [Gallionella sp.]|nr:hypothetical protein [Gallionella sp.]NNM79741.1 hypothetical protein [Gallionella sp.]
MQIYITAPPVIVGSRPKQSNRRFLAEYLAGCLNNRRVLTLSDAHTDLT